MFPKEEKLLKSIGIFRYEHSLRVLETSININRNYNIKKTKLETAALYHDCGKIGSNEEILKEINNNNIKLSEEDIKSPEILHSILGRYLAEFKYKIKDLEILNAVRYHTTGKENMNLLEKIIFISDYIEPGRKFSGVEQVRKLAEKNIEEAIILAMKNTIDYLNQNNQHVHLDTIKGLEYLLKTKE